MKRLLSAVIFFCAIVGFSASITMRADAQNNGQQQAGSLPLKERWMRVPAELQLTPDQTTQFNAYAADLHQEIRSEHAKLKEKLKLILTPAQLSALKEWGESYRHQHEEQTVLADPDMNKSLDTTAKQLHLTPNQAQQFKKVTLVFHHKKHELFEQFNTKLNALLTDEQKTKFAEMKEDL